jgi:hypothetical protein
MVMPSEALDKCELFFAATNSLVSHSRWRCCAGTTLGGAPVCTGTDTDITEQIVNERLCARRH